METQLRIGRLRVILNGPVELSHCFPDGKAEEGSYWGRAIALVFIQSSSQLGPQRRLWESLVSNAAVSSFFVFYKSLLYAGRDSWFCLSSICLRVDKDKEGN